MPNGGEGRQERTRKISELMKKRIERDQMPRVGLLSQ